MHETPPPRPLHGGDGEPTVAGWRDLSRFWRRQAADLSGERRLSAMALSHDYAQEAVRVAFEVLRDASLEQVGQAAPRVELHTSRGVFVGVCRCAALAEVPGGPLSLLSYVLLELPDGGGPLTVLLRDVLDVALLDGVTA
jgi:hypothetical protein